MEIKVKGPLALKIGAPYARYSPSSPAISLFLKTIHRLLYEPTLTKCFVIPCVKCML